MIELTPNQEDERTRASEGRARHWFCLIEWGGTVGDQYLGLGSVAVKPGTTTEDELLEAPEFQMSVAAAAQGKTVTARGQLKIRNNYGDSDAIWSTLEEVGDVEGVTVKIYSVFQRKDGGALAEADWRLEGIFHIDEKPELTPKMATVRLIGTSDAAGGVSFGRQVSRSLFPLASVPETSWGQTIPRVYGTLERMPTIPLDMGYSTTLDGDLTATSETVYVFTIEDFESSGTLRIDAEFVDYNGVEDAGDGVGSRFVVVPGGRGANGTEPTIHRSGAVVREARSLYTWIVGEGELWALVDKTIEGDTVNTSPVISNLDFSTAILKELDAVTGPGIPAGAVVSSIDAIDQVTLSENATATGTVDLRFTRTVQAWIGKTLTSADVLVEDLDGSLVTYLTRDSLPLIRETAPSPSDVPEEDLVWSDGGESNCDSIFPNGATFATTGSWSTGSALVTGLGVNAEERLLEGMSVAGVGIPGDAVIISVDSASQVTLSEDATDTQVGAAIAFTGTIFPMTGAGAIDRGDLRHTSFAYLDPVEEEEGVGGARLLDLDLDTDLSGRASFFRSARILVSYRVAPGQSLTSGTPDIVWGNPTIGVYRDGVQVLLQDVGRPALEIIQGKLDQLLVRPSVPTDGPDDFKGLFLDANPLAKTVEERYSSGSTFVRVEEVGNPAQFFNFRRWPGYVGDAEPKPFVGGRASVGISGSVVAGINYRESLMKMKSVFVKVGGLGENDQVFGNITIKAKVSVPDKDFLSGFTRISVRAQMDGAEVEGGGQFDVAENDSKLVTMTFAGDFTRAQINSLRVVARSDYYSGILPPEPDGVVNRLDELLFTFDDLSIEIVRPTTLVGGRKDPVFNDQDVINQGVVSVTPTMVQSIPLTDLILRDPLFEEDPWSFIKNLTVRVALDAESSPTKLLVEDVALVPLEYATIERSPNENELALLVDVDGGVYADDPVRAGAWVGPAPIERPEDVVYDWLVNVMGLAPSQIDLADDEFGGLLFALERRQSWKLARRVDVEASKRVIFESLCQDAGLMAVEDGGRWRFLHTFSFVAGNSVALMQTASSGTDNLLANLEQSFSPRSDLVNEAGTYFKRSYSAGRTFTSRDDVRDSLSIDDLGLYRRTFDLEWVREPETAQGVGDSIIRRFARRLRTVRARSHEAMCNVECGDVVTLTDEWGGVASATGVIAGRSCSGGRFRDFAVVMSGLPIRVWTADGDDTTYIDVSGGVEMVFVIEGVLVAVLRKGVLELLGNAVEATISGTQTETMEKDGTSIWFAVDVTAPPRTRLAELTKSGDLRTTAILERSNYPFVSAKPDYIFEFTPTPELQFSTELKRVHMSMTVAGVLVGSVREGAIG